jgi:murein DD-endopeptidase MepM/ murein hydrolase activator NlpD
MTGKISAKRQNYLSFMFVPHRKGNVHTIRINNYRTTLLSATAIMLVSLLMLTGYTLSVVRQNISLKTQYAQDLELIQSQKTQLEDFIASQTKQLIEKSDLVSVAASAKSVSADAVDQYKTEYENMVIAYVDKNMETVNKVSRGSSKEKTFKEGLADLRSLIDVIQSAKLSEEDATSKIAKKEVELTSYINALPTYWPVDNSTTIHSKFGRRLHPIYKRYINHDGIDIGEKTSPKIYAAAEGKVIEAAWRGGYGNCIIISHGNGFKTVYGHLKSYKVKEGDWVKKGQQIAVMGNTGTSTDTHLHFEVRVNDVPTEPTKYLEKR